MFKIKNGELIKEISGEAKQFPKYTTQIINLANQNSQGTRPKVVGQLSELIQKCPHKEYSKWKEWYLQQQPKAIDKATDKIFPMIEELKKAINQIDKNMVRAWVKDLVIDKTFRELHLSGRGDKIPLCKNCSQLYRNSSFSWWSFK